MGMPIHLLKRDEIVSNCHKRLLDPDGVARSRHSSSNLLGEGQVFLVEVHSLGLDACALPAALDQTK